MVILKPSHYVHFRQTHTDILFSVVYIHGFFQNNDLFTLSIGSVLIITDFLSHMKFKLK